MLPDRTFGAYQEEVGDWMHKCFGPEITTDVAERCHRFLEEALELVQALGCSVGEAHELVDYVYARPVGDPQQEVGGVLVTLSALANAKGMRLWVAGRLELDRVWTKIEAIRAKNAKKPKFSPLPGPSEEAA